MYAWTHPVFDLFVLFIQCMLIDVVEVISYLVAIRERIMYHEEYNTFIQLNLLCVYIS